VRPQLAADMGILPDVGPLYGAAVGVAWPRVRFEIDGGFQPAQDIADPSGRGGQIRMLASLDGRACLQPWPGGRLEPAGCLAAAFAWMRSTGRGLGQPETHDALAVAVAAGAALSLRLYDWLWLRAEAFVGAPVRRPSFEINGTEEVHRVGALTGRLGGGVELRL